MLVASFLAGCSPLAAPTPSSNTPTTTAPLRPWLDVTETAIGDTGEWTHKVELADIDGDGLVDLLFANGGNYDSPGKPAISQVFLNQGPGKRFKEVSQEVLGPTARWVRVIKVRDVNGDEHPDIMLGATYESQSQLYLGDGSGNFTKVTSTHLPQVDASIGDLEFGDVDGDQDLDVVLADWGPGSPMSSVGGRTMLWLNDGAGHFSDATGTRMPDVLVKFSWELEFADVDDDYDLDVVVSCKMCKGSFLFENDGTGGFTDVTAARLPQYPNNYDFEVMDLDGDGHLDLVTINDGVDYREHIFLNDQRTGFDDATAELWPMSENLPCDDNMAAFLDFDSDGDADLLIGSLSCPERLLLNDGSGHLKQAGLIEGSTPGTLGIAVGDLDGDHKLDVAQAQGEAAFEEKIYLGQDIPADTAPPSITRVEEVGALAAGQPVIIRARVHDHKSPTMPQDWRSVVLSWTAGGRTRETPMRWYGEYLWRGTIHEPPDGGIRYQVCATDAAGNEACSLRKPAGTSPTSAVQKKFKRSSCVRSRRVNEAADAAGRPARGRMADSIPAA